MMTKITKYSVFLGLIAVITGGLYYLNLSNRHKAIVKTRLNHVLGLVDNDWNVIYNNQKTSYVTPTFVIDNIYKSMEGPKAMRSFQIDYRRNDLVWLTSFKTVALSTNERDVLSNDYICHTNVDYYDGEHFGKWNLNHRIGQQYPRLTSMSNGIESFQFPRGFGFPLFTNENLFLSTQTLNHNITDQSFQVKHKIELGYQDHNSNMKPLKSKTIFIMLPYDQENPFQGPTDTNPNACLPVETKNHSYIDESGNALSGHWVIFPGKMTFSYDVTKQLALKDSTSMHQIAVHLHPFAQTLSLRDKTTDSTLFISEVQNETDKIGLTKVSSFSSEKGIMLYPEHNYELVLTTNNNSGQDQDMMASMFVFLYDKEMHDALRNYEETN
ncbi:MAG: hypothetical protein AAGH46_08280 [Bacteroidota bacterium]